LNCLDSSFWIEYFSGDEQAKLVLPLMRDPAKIIVPSICLVEVGRFLIQQHGEELAQEDLRAMEQSQLMPLEAAIAGQAVRLGLKHKLAMADSIIYATARAMDAILWTLDRDFEGLPHVKYFPKKQK
jgi:predicted nucleic acid-binding protein